ncbi:MFS transporter [Demequina sp. NBRC 110054]|uniref:CynX/NimT family MFS transporter n=1 Tax=Demequina sp. NBRC 110054 TaxID=1570343 RepID=UPI0009FD20A5|nr:MFS transporter [Demequina sp. NBRC 110054]
MRNDARRGWRLNPVYLVASVLLIASTLRAPITSVGPVIDRIGEATGLGSSALGLLGTLPLVSFAVVSPFVSRLARRWGAERVVLLALVVLVAATVLRSLSLGLGALWAGTLLIGAAIAVGNVLVPALVKRDFPAEIPLMTGAYTTVLGGFAAIASGLAVPITVAYGWRVGIGCWALFGVLAVAAWAPRVVQGGGRVRRSKAGADPDGAATDGSGLDGAEPYRAAPYRVATETVETEPVETEPVTPDAVGTGAAAGAVTDAGVAPHGSTASPTPLWRSADAWWVTAFMACQSMLFYVLVTWLPSIDVSYGASAVTAGWHQFGFQTVGIVAGFAVTAFMRGRADQRLVAATASLGAIVGLVGLVLAPASALVWILIVGTSAGAAFVISMTLVAQRARTEHTAARLSGMAQGVGYAVAAVGPLLAGVVFDRVGTWTPVVLGLAAVGCAQLLAAVFAGRAHHIGGPVPERSSVNA